jgi:hypothetical protein
MTDWESTFATWSKPPSQTEQDRCANAEQAVKNAIKSSAVLRNRDIRVFTQGSYRNNTNIRRESDVDVAIVCYDVLFSQTPHNMSDTDFGLSPATYEYSQFKHEVGQALTEFFGGSVTRGNKAFNVRENTYHVEADVAPFFEHRRYEANGNYLSGVELRPDNGGRVINWPQQHYDNGVAKNNRTNRNFKSLVRVLKSLGANMDENNIGAAKNVPGFLIECLAWNCPDQSFSNLSFAADVRSCLAHLFNNTMTDDKCSEWGEVSELKYLFRGGQKWTRQQAHNFISAAWDYVGFE